MVSRYQVRLVQVRACDIEPGDIVNKFQQDHGWFEVDTNTRLHDGRMLISDSANKATITVEPLDLVWLQIAEHLEGNSHLALPRTRSGTG